MTKAGIPYYRARSTKDAARAEISKILRKFGCESIGFMDDFAKHTVQLVFVHRGRHIDLRASAEGWAALWLKENPRANRQAALNQGMIAVNSILRDWVKGQVTAVECGVLSFDAVFIPFMLASDGRTVLQHLSDAKLLPAPTNG